MKRKSQHRAAQFIIILMVIMFYPTYMLITGGEENGSDLFLVLLMFSPAVAAIITSLMNKESIKELGFKKASIKYFAMAYLIPLSGCILVYGFAWLTGIGDIGEFIVWETALNGFLGPFIMILLVIGEEIGWRGYLFPRLYEAYGYHKASLITGISWSIFHYPVIFFAGYNSDQSIVLSVIFFTMGVMGASYIAGYLMLRGGSIFAVALFHSSHNTFVQMVFDKITDVGEHTTLFTSEFGIGLAVFYVVVAYYFSKKVTLNPLKYSRVS